MLVDFQQALAELVGSPELTAAVRDRPSLLAERYDLTDAERARLAAMVAHRGMTANLVLYRANRLAPVVLNLPKLCDALGPELKPLLWAYWRSTPRSDVHFLVESDRFRVFVEDAIGRGDLAPDVARAARGALAIEGLVLSARLEASRNRVEAL